MGPEMLRYDGKRVVVSGGASGMGEAIANIVSDLGGEVFVLDVKEATSPTATSITMDLRNPEEIDAALTAVGAPIHAVFSCAGVSGAPFSPLDVMLINFVGARHLVERAADRMMPAGSAIAMISSIGGLNWEKRLEMIMGLLKTPNFETAREWCSENVAGEPDNAEMQAMLNYAITKQALDVYVQYRAVPFMHKRIRINATGPGPTQTPLQRATPMWTNFAEEDFQVKMGLAASSSEQQAYPLVFLCSDAASFVSGQVLNVDAGYTAGGRFGVIETVAAPPIVPLP
jgi:NAD(P)-dependent dehydrogenase (short-subunit alcohol dehydrogenase family)